MPTGHRDDKVSARKQKCVPRSTGMGIKTGLFIGNNKYVVNFAILYVRTLKFKIIYEIKRVLLHALLTCCISPSYVYET